MQTGWVNDRGYWFYLDSSGKMLTGFQTINGYKLHFADNGSMALGWFRVASLGIMQILMALYKQMARYKGRMVLLNYVRHNGI